MDGHTYSRYVTAGPLDKLVSIKVERRGEEIKLFDRFYNRKGKKKLNPPFSSLSSFLPLPLSFPVVRSALKKVIQDE